MAYFRATLLAMLLAALPALAGAFEIHDLEPEATAYRASIEVRYAGTDGDWLVPFYQARMLANQDKWKEAVAFYERSVAATPEIAELWLDLARAWTKASPSDEHGSLAAYRAFVLAATNQQEAWALTVLGDALAGERRFPAALSVYRQGLALAESPAMRERLRLAIDKYDFQAIEVTAKADTDRPELCIRFRYPLTKSRTVRYEDYIRVDPRVSGAMLVRGGSLCLTGVAHGAGYKVTVLAGLPALDGETTAADRHFEATVPDRPPSVAFTGGTYVLPRYGSTGVPVVTVNVSRLKLKLLRIGERNLIDELKDGSLGRLLRSWELRDVEGDRGELVWQGEMSVKAKPNRRVITAFPIDEYLERPEPGIYILIAEPVDGNPERRYWRATQWVLSSDLGLVSIKGDDGFHIYARSLTTGDPVPGVTMRLFSRGNTLLGETRTGGAGMASFAPGLLRGKGGRAARAVYAFSEAGDFNFLDLGAPPFDLGDRGVGGRQAPGPIDAFLYADRGVYRPGEVAHVVALLRDPEARAIEWFPITLRLLRPDGAEVRREVLRDDRLGAFSFTVPFSKQAVTGRWTVRVHVDDPEKPVGQLSLLVEDVVPPRIELKMATQAKILVPKAKAEVAVRADYFYGAPAAGLAAAAAVVVSKDTTPYPGYQDYSFGLADEDPQPRRYPLKAAKTDATGALELEVTLGDFPDTTQPLKAVIRANLFEPGGRPAVASLTLPLRQYANAIGLRPRFTGKGVGEDEEAGFDVIALGRNGERIAAGLQYAFYREDWDYRWFLRHGVWDYKINVSDKPLSGGVLSLDGGKPAAASLRVAWGRYRLEVFDAKTGAATSIRFTAGWSVAPALADTPDSLEMVTDKELYRPGETVRVHLKAPFAGKVLLNVVNESLLLSRTLSLPAGGATVEFPFEEDWGIGAYILATAFRPDGESRGPGRAIGVAWLGLDPGERTLEISLDVPEEARPRRKVDIPVSVSGLGKGGQAYVTLAAVDEGVLRLTGFKTPDPAGYFFGKRRLAVEVRDLYGRLIDGKKGRRGRVRGGGGAARQANRGAPPVDVEMVSLFSGLVALDGQGKATITLDLPDFNGRLRLMAVAFDGTRLGAGEASLPVRDPVVAQVSMPRFLAPGDDSRLTVTLHNLNGPKGVYEAVFSAEGAVALAGKTTFSVGLDRGESAVAAIGLKGLEPGTGRLRMILSGPGGETLERAWTLGVRPAQFPVTRRIARRLEPGASMSYSAALLEEFLPGTGEVLLTFSPRPQMDVPGLLRQLDRYPYGCLEQITSRALPLLYVGPVAKVWDGKGATAGTRRRVRQAIRRVLEMQRADGSFALWGSSGAREPWLSAYVMDFLTRARGLDYRVADFAFDHSLRWLKRRTEERHRQKSGNLATNAYAFYVLAANGAGDAGALRYFADRNVDRMPTSLAAAQVGAALALHGEYDRARLFFGKARALAGKRPAMRDYGSSLRDAAGLVALTAETGKILDSLQPDWGSSALPALVENLVERRDGARYTSPQEQAWMLLAAASVAGGNEGMTLSVNGEVEGKRRDPLYLRPLLGARQTYTNLGDAAIWHTATITGVPAEEEPAGGTGLDIERGFFTIDGKPVDPAKLRQNEQVVVLITGSAETNLDHQTLVVDFLPAGLEIENARLEGRGAAAELDWLPKLSKTVHVEFRDDRFVAAIDIKGDDRTFSVAYLARAVTPGTYVLPASQVEDMYKPRYRARTAMGRLAIAPAE